MENEIEEEGADQPDDDEEIQETQSSEPTPVKIVK
jgi:hypothetical protein